MGGEEGALMRGWRAHLQVKVVTFEQRVDGLDLLPPASGSRSTLSLLCHDATETYPVAGPPRVLFLNAMLPPSVLRVTRGEMPATWRKISPMPEL